MQTSQIAHSLIIYSPSQYENVGIIGELVAIGYTLKNMQKSIDNFLENYGKYIGHLANFIAVGAASVGLYNWLNPVVGFWQIITAIVFIGLLLSMYRSRQLKLKIIRLNEVLEVSNDTTSKLMLSISERAVADIKANGGVIPITEMASLLHAVKNVKTSMGASPEKIAEIDVCLEKLSEYERSTRR